MKKRGIFIAAIVIACVFVVTVIGFALGIYSDYNSGLKVAGTKFEKLSSRTAEASGIYPSGSKEFINLFNSAVGSPDIYESLTLQVDGNDVYVYPSNKIASSSAFVRSFSTRITGGDGANILLTAGIFLVTPPMIFYRAKVAFLIVLAGTLLACILLLYLYLGGNEKSDSGEIVFKKTQFDDKFGSSLYDEGDEAVKNEGANEDAIPSSPSSIEEAGAEEPSTEQEKPIQTEEKVDFNPLENAYEDHEKKGHAETATEAKAIPEEPLPVEEELPQKEWPLAEEPAAAEPAAEEPVAESPEPAEEAAPSQETPLDEKPLAKGQGLFSPVSGFGWESYLDTRLESELVRAASSEQDLSLIMIKIPGLNSNATCYADVCKTLLDFFQFKDFIFEYKEDGFAAIIQNKDVDQAMESAEILYADIQAVLSRAGFGGKTMMGISSRSLRLIAAQRLKNEAEQALLHADGDSDSPIIAFRVNPEKYRKYITGSGTES